MYEPTAVAGLRSTASRVGFAQTMGHSDKTQLTVRQAEHGRHDYALECEPAQLAPKPYVAELR